LSTVNYSLTAIIACRL